MKDRLIRLVNIAELYYYDHMTQAEIAKKLGISRSAVSLALTEMRKMGLVQIKIQKPYSNKEYVAAGLIKKFHLESCHVVALAGVSGTDAVRPVIQTAAASLLPYWKKDGLGGISGENICFDYLSQTMEEGLGGAGIVSLSGNRFHQAEGISLSDAILDFSRRHDLKAHVLYTPYLTQFPADRLTYQHTENYRQISALWDSLDCALAAADASFSSETLARLENPEQKLQHLMEHPDECAGVFCGRQINIAGFPLENDYNHCIMGISWETLGRVPAVFCMAAGQENFAAVLGGLNSGLIHHLIIDELLARRILELSMEYYPFREFLTTRR